MTEHPAVNARAYDAILLLGFGGPERPSAVRPFLDRVLAGRTIPAARYELVVTHYEQMGGAAPYNELPRLQAVAFERELRSRGDDTPVALAYRCVDPDIESALAEFARRGAERILGIILAPHQGAASWGRYVANVESARALVGPSAPVVEYLDPYFEHPLFVRAHVERTIDALSQLERPSLDETELVFTAHSIPTQATDAQLYVDQVTRTAKAVADELGARHWRIAYQSRSGAPNEPWLEPDIRDVIRDCATRGVRDVVVNPIGFLCDHVEVLYDLDIDAKAVADSLHVRMQRAGALNDHPAFIGALAELTLEKTQRARVLQA